MTDSCKILISYRIVNHSSKVAHGHPLQVQPGTFATLLKRKDTFEKKGCKDYFYGSWSNYATKVKNVDKAVKQKNFLNAYRYIISVQRSSFYITR